MPIRIAQQAEIMKVLSIGDVVPLMREALIAQSRGECETPMPMHLYPRDRDAEVHLKSSYRAGGDFFAVKIAGGYPQNKGTDLPTFNGLILLCSAKTGDPVAILCDGANLTHARTAAVSAMVAQELGRKDSTIGILGSGQQARWQARAHAEVLPLREIWIWGRTPAHIESCRADLTKLLPGVEIRIGISPADVARHAKLIITVTGAREAVLAFDDIAPGTLISAVGSDSPGKQELHPQILERAALLLSDTIAQCEKLGELQHAPSARSRAMDIGKFCEFHPAFDAGGIVVADFTGLGVEDLFIAEDCYRKLEA
jgi:ornithine cyclodeaminase